LCKILSDVTLISLTLTKQSYYARYPVVSMAIRGLTLAKWMGNFQHMNLHFVSVGYVWTNGKIYVNCLSTVICCEWFCTDDMSLWLVWTTDVAHMKYVISIKCCYVL